jgi:hypothetical protein
VILSILLNNLHVAVASSPLKNHRVISNHTLSVTHCAMRLIGETHAILARSSHLIDLGVHGLGDGRRLVAIGAPGDQEKKDGDETSHTRGHVRPPSGFILAR